MIPGGWVLQRMVLSPQLLPSSCFSVWRSLRPLWVFHGWRLLILQISAQMSPPQRKASHSQPCCTLYYITSLVSLTALGDPWKLLVHFCPSALDVSSEGLSVVVPLDPSPQDHP